MSQDAQPQARQREQRRDERQTASIDDLLKKEGEDGGGVRGELPLQLRVHLVAQGVWVDQIVLCQIAGDRGVRRGGWQVFVASDGRPGSQIG